MPLSGFDTKILNILHSSQIINQEQVEKAKTSETEQTIDEMLIDEGLVDEEMYVSILASQVGIPPINLDKVTPQDGLRDDIPEDLVTYHNIFPISKIGNMLTVAVNNPFDVINHDDFKVIVGCDLKKVLSTVPAIKRATERYYHAEELKVAEFMDNFGNDSRDNVELRERRDDEDDDLETMDGGSDIIDIVNKILVNAVRTRCTDVHFEPTEHNIRVRTRVDGILGEAAIIPKRYNKKLATRIKVMTSEMDISERRLPQDGSFRVLIGGRHIDFRVSSLPTVRGEKIALRILDKGILDYSLAELGFEENILTDLTWAINQPYGMILCNGPTGCGKTTTLYTSIQAINQITENVTTVEEPVEYDVFGLNQVNVNNAQGMTFPAALRSILRQDPDTIFIGEIRDSETINIAVKAALTGHLVFSTLHTNTAAGTIQRIIGLGVEPFLVGSALLLIMSQRLPKKLCPKCKQAMPRPTPEALMHFGFTEEEAHNKSYEFFQAKGCEKCKNVGYLGRFAICECLKVDEAMAALITQGASTMEIQASAMEKGMRTLRQSGITAIKNGITTFDEIKKVSGTE